MDSAGRISQADYHATLDRRDRREHELSQRIAELEARLAEVARTMDADGVRKRIRHLMALRNLKQKQVAAECGVSQAFISAVLHGDKEPSDCICQFVGVRRVVTYERVGRKRKT